MGTRVFLVFTILFVTRGKSLEEQSIKYHWSQTILVTTDDVLALSSTNSSYAILQRDSNYLENKLTIRSFDNGTQTYICTINLNNTFTSTYTSYGLTSCKNHHEVFTYRMYRIKYFIYVYHIVNMRTCNHQSYYSITKINWDVPVQKYNERIVMVRDDNYELLDTNLKFCQNRPCVSHYNLTTGKWSTNSILPAVGKIDDNKTIVSVSTIGHGNDYLFVLDDRVQQDLVVVRLAENKTSTVASFNVSTEQRAARPSGLHDSIGFCYVTVNETAVNCLRLDDKLKLTLNASLEYYPESYNHAAYNRKDGGMYMFSEFDQKEVRVTEIQADGEVGETKLLLKKECYHSSRIIFFEVNGDTCMRYACVNRFESANVYTVFYYCF